MEQTKNQSEMENKPMDTQKKNTHFNPNDPKEYEKEFAAAYLDLAKNTEANLTDNPVKYVNSKTPLRDWLAEKDEPVFKFNLLIIDEVPFDCCKFMKRYLKEFRNKALFKRVGRVTTNIGLNNTASINIQFLPKNLNSLFNLYQIMKSVKTPNATAGVDLNLQTHLIIVTIR